VWTRSIEVAYFSAGVVLCGISAKLVKNVIRQPRPHRAGKQKVTYGMPSTHSATIACYATYIPLTYLYPLYNSPAHFGIPSRALWSLLIVPGAVLIAVSRVWLGYHTWKQVAAGTTFGVVFSSLWFTLWVNAMEKHAMLMYH